MRVDARLTPPHVCPSQADAVLGGGPTVEEWLAKEPPLPVALHADLEARLRAARWLGS